MAKDECNWMSLLLDSIMVSINSILKSSCLVIKININFNIILVCDYLWFNIFISNEVMSCFMEDFMPECPSDKRVKVNSKYIYELWITCF